jgi:hypothetical protein
MVVLLAAVFTGCAAPVKGMCPPEAGEPAETVHLVVHGWHAGLVFPRDREAVLAWVVAREFADTQYVEVGWGDRDFYQAQEPHLQCLDRACAARRRLRDEAGRCANSAWSAAAGACLCDVAAVRPSRVCSAAPAGTWPG